MAGRTTRSDVAEAVRALNRDASIEGVVIYGAIRIGRLWRITRSDSFGGGPCFDNLTTAEAYLVLRGMAAGRAHAREDRHRAVFGGVNAAAYAASAEGGDR